MLVGLTSFVNPFSNSLNNVFSTGIGMEINGNGVVS